MAGPAVIGFLLFVQVVLSLFGCSRYYGNIIVENHPKAQIFVNGQQVGVGSLITWDLSELL
jgi:hypothetical protein